MRLTRHTNPTCQRAGLRNAPRLCPEGLGAESLGAYATPLAARRVGVVALAVLYLLFCHRLAGRDLWSSHEARAAMNAQTILDTGELGAAASLRRHAGAAKTAAVLLAGRGLRLAAGRPGRRLERAAAGSAGGAGVPGSAAGVGLAPGRIQTESLAATVLATALHFTWLARIGRIDMPLTLAVSTAIVAFYLARREEGGNGRLGLLLLGYLALAAGIMLKGPIGLVLPVAVLGVYWLVDGRAEVARPVAEVARLPSPKPPEVWRLPLRVWRLPLRTDRLGLWWGVPLVAGLTLPWFFWVNAATEGDFFRVFFWYHNVQRGLGGSPLRGHPWWFYGPQFALDFLPWSPLLAVAGWWCWRRRLWRRDPEVRLGLVWLLTVLAVLSCARFRARITCCPRSPARPCSWAACWRGTGGRPVSRDSSPSCAPLAGWSTSNGCCRATSRGGPGSHSRRRSGGGPAAPAEVIVFRAEDHLLAFHLGRPLRSLIEYHHLSDRLRRPGPHYAVMPPAWLDECRRVLPSLRFEEVLCSTDLPTGRPERPLVLLRCGTAPEK